MAHGNGLWVKVHTGWHIKNYLVKEFLIWFIVFGAERNVRKETSRCFKHHFLRDTLVIII
jgi:hypothetical protein